MCDAILKDRTTGRIVLVDLKTATESQRQTATESQRQKAAAEIGTRAHQLIEQHLADPAEKAVTLFHEWWAAQNGGR